MEKIPPPPLPKIPEIPIVPKVQKVHPSNTSDFDKCRNITGFTLCSSVGFKPQMKDFLKNYRHKIYDVKGDGNCFFHAISTGLLNKRNIHVDSDELRQEIVSFILNKNNNETLAYELNNDVMDRGEWENMMRTNGIFADGLIAIYMSCFLKIKYGLDLIIYKTYEDRFEKLDDSENYYKITDPATNINDNLIIIHTGNHYMTVIAELFNFGRHFGNPKKSRRRSKKRKL